MVTSNDDLRKLYNLCDWQSGKGRTHDGRSVRTEYRNKGNRDIFVDDQYVGTLWFS